MGLRYESMADMPAGMRQKYEKNTKKRWPSDFFSPKADGVPYDKKKKQNKYHAEQAAVPLRNGKVLTFDSRKMERKSLS